MPFRRLSAVVLVVLAVVWALVNKQIYEGPILLVISRTHGVCVSDLLSVALVLVAVALVVPRRRARPRR